MNAPRGAHRCAGGTGGDENETLGPCTLLRKFLKPTIHNPKPRPPKPQSLNPNLRQVSEAAHDSKVEQQVRAARSAVLEGLVEMRTELEALRAPPAGAYPTPSSYCSSNQPRHMTTMVEM